MCFFSAYFLYVLCLRVCVCGRAAMLNLQKSILANKHGRDGYSTPCANIMTNPGSTITSSLMCGLSQLNTNTACLPVD